MELADRRALAVACQAAVPEPFGYAKSEQETAERNAHERNNECEPASVAVGASAGKSAKHGLKKQCGQQADGDNGTAPLQELPCAVIGFSG
jgi:hypothetical protein